jgi:hypothetical protein
MGVQPLAAAPIKSHSVQASRPLMLRTAPPRMKEKEQLLWKPSRFKVKTPRFTE